MTPVFLYLTSERQSLGPATLPRMELLRSLSWLSNIPLHVCVTSLSTCACRHAQSLRSCPTLSNPMNCSLPDSSVRWIFHTRILEWVVISFSRGSSQPRDWTHVSCIAGRFFTTLSYQSGWKPLAIGQASGPLLNVLHVFIHLLLPQPDNVGTIITPISQMRKLRLREAN